MGAYFNKDLFGKRLLGVMKDNNDTTYSLSEFLHLSPSAISRYTSGDMAPKILTVEAIANKYGVRPTWLMGIEGEDATLKRVYSNRPNNYSSYWAKMVVTKKMPKVRFHDLRHYHASWLYNHGIPEQYAAKRLGHDIQILKSIYQHLGVSKEQEIDDNIRQLYNDPRPQNKPPIREASLVFLLKDYLALR